MNSFMESGSDESCAAVFSTALHETAIAPMTSDMIMVFFNGDTSLSCRSEISRTWIPVQTGPVPMLMVPLRKCTEEAETASHRNASKSGFHVEEGRFHRTGMLVENVRFKGRSWTTAGRGDDGEAWR